jgi:hypothetical protein
MRLKTLCAIGTGILACVVTFAQTPLPSAPGRRVVTTSPAEKRGNERSIVVHPNNTNHVVAAETPSPQFGLPPRAMTAVRENLQIFPKTGEKLRAHGPVKR